MVLSSEWFGDTVARLARIESGCMWSNDEAVLRMIVISVVAYARIVE